MLAGKKVISKRRTLDIVLHGISLFFHIGTCEHEIHIIVEPWTRSKQCNLPEGRWALFRLFLRQGACSREEFQGHVKAYPMPMVKVVQFFPKKKKTEKNGKIAAARLCAFPFLASRRQIFQYRYFYLFRHYHRFTSWRQGKLDWTSHFLRTTNTALFSDLLT